MFKRNEYQKGRTRSQFEPLTKITLDKKTENQFQNTF